MSDKRRKLDELIDWYEQNKPHAGSRIPVGVVRATVLRWGIKPEKRGGPIIYRGRELETKQDGLST